MEGIADLDAFFVHDTQVSGMLYPSSFNSTYYGVVSENGSSASHLGPYGSPVVEVNGSVVSSADRDAIHDAYAGRKLVYHRSASTTSWPKVVMGYYNSTNHALNITQTKFSEMIWYDSDQHGNQAGIESNINTHYSIY